jgi:hypothetical protein
VIVACGHEVLEANPRLMEGSKRCKRKNDRIDAQKLAQLARTDPKSLYPILHRSREVRQDLLVLRARDALVTARTQLTNAIRGLVKSMGARLPECTSPSFSKKVAEAVPTEIQPCQRPRVQTVVLLSALPDQTNPGRVGYDDLMLQFAQSTTHSGRMRPCLECQPTTRHGGKDIHQRLTRGTNLSFHNDLSAFVQHTIEARPISQIQTDCQHPILHFLARKGCPPWYASSLPISYFLRIKRVDNLSAYRIPKETGLLIPSIFAPARTVCTGCTPPLNNSSIDWRSLCET